MPALLASPYHATSLNPQDSGAQVSAIHADLHMEKTNFWKKGPKRARSIHRDFYSLGIETNSRNIRFKKVTKTGIEFFARVPTRILLFS
jgi:hypothetical protein